MSYINADQTKHFTEPESLSVNQWTRNPWLPLLIEWEVDFIPFKEGVNSNFDKDFLQTNFIANQAGDLQYKKWNLASRKLISGRSVLNDLTSYNLHEKLQSPTEQETASGAFKKDILGIVQTLDGFTDGLLMQRKNVEFKIVDPKDRRQFMAHVVHDFLGNNHYNSPSATLAFCPIRNGVFMISKVQIIDVFGQGKTVVDYHNNIFHYHTYYAQPLKLTNDIKTQIEKSKVEDYGGILPPRISQAARFNFDFTTADSFNTIHGWIIPNHLQSSLLLFDQAGNALGYLGQRDTEGKVGHLREVGDHETVQPGLIMQKVINYFTGPDQNIDTLKAFIDSHSQMLQKKILPNQHAAYQWTHLLGRPIAITTVAMSIELEHLPAAHLSWRSALISTLAARDNSIQAELNLDRQFSALEIPIYLGNTEDKTDGLIAYFKSIADTQTLHTPHTFPTDDGNPNEAVIKKSLFYPSLKQIEQLGQATEQDAILFVDPALHFQATTGILPKATLQLDQEAVDKTLSKLQYSFPIHPVLRNKNTADIPVPTNEHLAWYWIEKTTDPATNPTKKTVVPPLDILTDQVVLSEGWLSLEEKEDK